MGISIFRGRRRGQSAPTTTPTPSPTPSPTPTPTPAPSITLIALALSGLSYTVGLSASGAITGKTSGSTVELDGTLPDGLTLDLTAMTWAWDGTGDVSTGSFDLIETHPDATNSPLTSPQAWDITDDSLDASLIAPVISVTTAQATLPPVLSALIDITTLTTDNIRCQVSLTDDFAALISIATPLVEVGEDGHDFGLSALVTPAKRFYRQRIERGSTVGPWSNTVVSGDTDAPTITSANSASGDEGTVNPTGTLTADEPVTWSITGGTDSASFVVNATTGVWTLTATTNYETQSSYVVQFTATDVGGNTTNQSFTYTVNDLDEPTTYSETYKYTYLTLSNGDLTATSQTANVGSMARVRGSKDRGGKRYFEVTVNTRYSAHLAGVGLCDADLSMTTGVPGTDGVLLRSDGYTYNGAGSATLVSALAFTSGDVISVAFDITAGKAWFAKNGTWSGNPALGTGGVTLPAGWTTAFPLCLLTVALTGTNQQTINCGASAFAYPLPSGFSPYDPE